MRTIEMFQPFFKFKILSCKFSSFNLISLDRRQSNFGSIQCHEAWNLLIWLCILCSSWHCLTIDTEDLFPFAIQKKVG